MSKKFTIPSRILVVEDNLYIQKLVSFYVEEFGLEAIVAEDGNEALDIMETEDRLSAIITDINMPGLNGIEFIRRATYLHPNVFTIVVSAEVEEDQQQELKNLGVTYIVDKAIKGEDLYKILKNYVNTHQYDTKIISHLGMRVPQIINNYDPDIRINLENPFLRASSSLLGRVSACVDIGGIGLCGSLVLSGTPGLFTHIVRRWLQAERTDRDLLWDAMGELANQIASSIRDLYLNNISQCIISAPRIVEGDRVRQRYLTSSQSLVLPFKINERKNFLFVEWVLTEDKNSVVKSPSRSLVNREGEVAKNITIVDDSKAVRTHLRSLLTGSGFNVAEASNGVMGFNMIQEELPDLVLADVNMPAMNGLAMVEKLRQLPSCANLPVIMLTTNKPTKEDREMNAGVKWIQKSASSGDIIAGVQESLGLNPLEKPKAQR